MLTIAGSGMGMYNFNNIDIDFEQFEIIFCDKNYKTDLKNIVQGDFKFIKNEILKNLDKNLLYIVTGSPLFFSGGIIIINYLKKKNIPFKIVDNVSSLNYMLSHEGVSLLKTDTISLHGKTEIDLTKFLTNEYTFIICDENTPKILQKATYYLNDDDINITLGECFGYKNETFKNVTIDELIKNPPKMPYSLLIKKEFSTLPNISDEDSIEHENGMITKTYKRHISLQNLELQPNMILWDIGAGSGSISIDGYKRYKIRTFMFEKNKKRINMIKNSLTKHKIIDTKLYEGQASNYYKQEKSTPNRIFIGGGGDEVICELDYLYEKLADNGIMVANFVTLQNLTTAINTLKKANIIFDIKSISLTTYKMNLLMPEPERIMHQIIIKKTH